MSSLSTGSAAPDFELRDLQGQSLRLSQMQGNPVLLNFYKSTCPWCQLEMPRLAEIYRHHEALDVQVVGVVVGQDDEARADKFARDKNLTFKIAVDADRKVRADYHLERVPTLVLLDAEGRVLRVYEGSTEQLAGIVDQSMLAAAGGEAPPEYYLTGNG